VTRRRQLATWIAGLTVICLGIVATGFMDISRPAPGTDRNRLEISSVDLTTANRDAIFSARFMAPGDIVAATMTVANPSRQPVTYAMSRGPVSVGGEPLAATLLLTVKSIGSSCADYDGATLFNGPLDEAAFGSEVIGRLLPAASAEILCFRAALPLAAGNDLQGATTTVTLSFGASWQAAAR
jgi:hypothetical protein